jgi:hypothetical protein
MSNKITILECNSFSEKNAEAHKKNVRVFIGFNKIGEIGMLFKESKIILVSSDRLYFTIVKIQFKMAEVRCNPFKSNLNIIVF